MLPAEDTGIQGYRDTGIVTTCFIRLFYLPVSPLAVSGILAYIICPPGNFTDMNDYLYHPAS